MSKARGGLRPQDILIALKVLVSEEKPGWKQLDLAKALGLSPAEMAYSLERLRRHHFLQADKKHVNRAALLEFLVHGLKYVFPAERGAPTRGIPTSTAVALIGDIRISDDQLHVWPSSEGKRRGIAIEPLYESVPIAVSTDEKLYRLLALIDVLRVGTSRESNLAQKALEKIILKSVPT
jgi:hypothetical protein